VPEPQGELVDLLGLLRRRLHMDYAWLGRLDGDLLIIQVASGDTRTLGIGQGSSVRPGASLFTRVLSGELPSLIPDVRADPRTRDVPIVCEFDVGAYAATPVVDTEGQIYGMLGAFSRQACPTLRERDGGFLRLLASFLTEFVIDLRHLWEERSALWWRIREVLDDGGPRMLYQPVVELATGRTIGIEALARFPATSAGPHDVFAAAQSVGLGLELELAAVRNAVRVLPEIPPNVILAVNASPATVVGGLIELVLGTGEPEHLAVEVTEHAYIGDDHDLLLATETLRGHGTHIAVDDVGSCYSGLEQLLHLRPEVIKVDCFITHGIDQDAARRAVAAGLTKVAEEIGGRVVAEGIERPAELDAVIEAGIPCGQGYLLGPPTADIEEAVQRARWPATASARPRGTPTLHGPRL
jgi:EAL domain-containing protein (putative c-di-GMP-specific phosphodiesterase class I)